jgi:SNF2 family DNA or RNA helicase
MHLPLKIIDRMSLKRYEVDDHQQAAYGHLLAHDRAALFLGMGMSKTVVVLSYLWYRCYADLSIKRALVIAPDKVARVTWPDEAAKWAHLKGMRLNVVKGDPKQRAKLIRPGAAEVYVMGVDNVAWLVDRYCGDLSPHFDCLVIDELDLFKSHSSQRFKALRKSVKGIPYRIGMTGTPTPNGLTALYSEIMLLDDGERLGTTWTGFVDKYFDIRGRNGIVYEYRPKPRTEAILADKLSDIALTLRTEDCIKLPPLTVTDVELSFDDAQRRLYDTLERDYIVEALPDMDSPITSLTAADIVNKLAQITGGAAYYTDNEGVRLWQTLNTVKLDALEALRARLKDANLLVVYQYQHEAERILARINGARILTKNPEDIAAWNRGEIKTLLIHPASAGHGLNLQAGGSLICWYGLTYNLGNYQQTIARLWRRGQNHPVTVYRLIVKDTIDGTIARRLEGKDFRQRVIMREIQKKRQSYGY